MNKTKQKLIIIDGNALIHRSFHALPPTMTTKKGEMVNAIYGFASFLIKAIREFKPEYAILTLDKKAPTFRHKKFKEYKAKRIKAPDDLYKQIPRIKELTQAFNIPIFEMNGFEADDLIGTIANKIKNDIESIIVTGDLDTLQLINEHTKVYTMSRGISDSFIYDKKAIKERYGLEPKQMIDYKALRGDPSDNIPGVRGIGEKTAIELLQKFKTLDKIYEYLDKNKKSQNKIKPRIKDLLLTHKNNAYLSKELATIKCDVPIKFNLDDAQFKNYNQKKIIKFLSELEFKSLLPRIQNITNQNSKNNKVNNEIINKFERNKKDFKYYLIKEEKKFKNFLDNISKQKRITFDTETSSLDTLTSSLLGISFSWKKSEAYYIKINNKELKIKNNCNETNLFNYKINSSDNIASIKNPWLKKLKPIFENKNIKKSAHNAKFDIKVMRNNGIIVKGLDFDTMIASYLLNPGTRQHNLDSVVFTELGFEKISKEDLLGKGKNKITFNELNDEKLSIYSCEDADFTNQLVKKLKKQLKEKNLESLFNKIEMPLIKVLAHMEDNGIIIDKDFLAEISKKITITITNLEKKIYKEAGIKFNINSTQQLKEILFEKLEIPTDNIKKTKTGLSTAADELIKLKEMHSIIPLIQEYRELTKLITTYIDALPKLINKKTGRVHTSFNQAVTATGRLSSTEPNLQNIPAKTELGQKIRKAFVAQNGYQLVSLDYSQIELRLAAHMSGDKKMITAFKNGSDIHTLTAAEINHIEINKVTKKMRREAKATNFGILYGQGPHGLSQTAGIPYAQAKEFIEKYFQAYKNIKKYINKTIALAKKNGYVETLFGRRRYLPEINSSIIMIRKSAERMAINTPIQGTAADIIKIAMIKIEPIINKYKKDAKMLLQVHDELVLEIKNNKVEKIAKEVKNIMENIIKLKIPVVVDIKAGKNWGNLVKLSFKGMKNKLL